MDVDDLEEATEDVLVHSIADAVDDECDMTSIPRVTSVEELIVDRCYIAYLSNLLVLATTPIRKTCLTCAGATMPVVSSQIGTAIVLTWVS